MQSRQKIVCLLQVQLQCSFPDCFLFDTLLIPVKCGIVDLSLVLWMVETSLVFLIIWLIETFEYMAVPFR